MRNLSITSSLLTMAVLLTSSAIADDWRQFRGNESNGLSADSDLPTELSGEAIRWRIELPGRGTSGPIAVADKVFLTASSALRERKLHTLCFDAETGKKVWERTAIATGRTVCHPKMAVATPTPASDGKRVFSFYSSNDLICHDLNGNLLWYRGLGLEFPNASNSLGMSSSPVVVGSTVIVQVESDAESFAIGVDAATGETKWRIVRPQKANWTSPVVVSTEKPIVLLQSTKGLAGIDVSNGKELWNYTKGASSIPSATAVGKYVFIASNGITVLKVADDGASYEIAWKKSNINPSTPSPLAAGKNLYTINYSGVLACNDSESGKRSWQLRLKGQFSATPLAANGYVYLFNEAGMAYVVKPGESSGKVVSQLDLTETLLSTPAIADGALFVRSDGHLWKLAKP